MKPKRILSAALVAGALALFLHGGESGTRASKRQAGDCDAGPMDALPALCRYPRGVSRGKIAARAASEMIGIPYSWGGGGPDGPTFGIGQGAKTKGFDCSGLTEYAWAQAGVAIGSSSYEQWRSGTKITRDRLRRGDLAFFETDGRRDGPDHVGVVVNAAQMVVSPFTGARVRIESIDRPSFVGLIRPRIYDSRVADARGK